MFIFDLILSPERRQNSRKNGRAIRDTKSVLRALSPLPKPAPSHSGPAGFSGFLWARLKST
jgi:hypothetical protein